MFHGKNAKGGADDNQTKEITTRSGNTIIFNDTDGSITLKDKVGSESTVTLDGKQNISISSSATISLTVGASSITLDKDGNIDINGTNVSINGTDVATMASGGAASFTASKDGKANVESSDTTVHGKNTTTISGQTKTTVTAVGQTVIDSAVVKLN